MLKKPRETRKIMLKKTRETRKIMHKKPRETRKVMLKKPREARKIMLKKPRETRKIMLKLQFALTHETNFLFQRSLYHFPASLLSLLSLRIVLSFLFFKKIC